jgi:hypothetical protein
VTHDLFRNALKCDDPLYGAGVSGSTQHPERLPPSLSLGVSPLCVAGKVCIFSSGKGGRGAKADDKEECVVLLLTLIPWDGGKV